MADIFYFDSCAFLAWFKEEPGRVDTMAALFAEAEKGSLKVLTSTLTIAEVLNLQGQQSPIPKSQRDAVRSLFLNDWIVPKGVNRRMAEISQDLVWDYGVKPKDGIHIATALMFKVQTFYTYDEKLVKKGNLVTSLGEVKICEPLPPAQEDLFNGKNPK